MPLVKQGEFQKSYQECKRVMEEAEIYRRKYFDDIGGYNCNYDVFSDFFYEVDFVYIAAKNAKNKLENMILLAELKSETSVEKCNNYISEMNQVIEQCVQDFQEIYDSFEHNFTFAQKDTFVNYNIYRDRIIM